MAMSQQLSLRVTEDLRRIIRARLEEMRRASDRPERVTEADAIRSLIKFAHEADARTVTIDQLELTNE